MSTTLALDRLAMRARPPGTPVMHQNCTNLLFLHWPVEPERLRPLIPAELEIDTFEGQAWIGLTPFSLHDVHLTGIPPIPGLSSFHQLNVRACVHANGIPGIWFFSLDASKMVAAVAARIFFMLPYFKAQIESWQTAGQFSFDLSRVASSARFRASWKTGVRLRDPDLESLAFFLVERYCYFGAENKNLYMTRIYHHPWILDEATDLSHESTMIEILGIREPTTDPLAYFSREQTVDTWKPTKL
jgi:uncharacterized protein